ncbi:tetratricopeptide repeat protein [Akkermansiaceae bacterium]|nr:tetratricopeptide repeat protein [Akkermansiaceae bacterium]MDB4310864.1 tetratricopeptide repeat protein [bacterium]MDB4258288.1 tetratricopeptide repeat protein [Akkermansiaceae bacterium]MDB4259060.1 tetratricopeptide repeat protein [Akkermansiaceae bacterium]MDB4310368.1 tetratricopeptide repeat protein [Akkermansiaceae bacterium]
MKYCIAVLNLIALFFAIAPSALAQDPDPLPPVVEPPAPLTVKPSRDLFDIATLYYNSAAETKDAAKKDRDYRLAAGKFDRFLRAFPQDEKSLDAWYFLALTYRQIGEDKASRQCFETIATRWTKGKFVAGSALFLASDDYENKKWAEAAKWFAILAKSTNQEKVRHESLYRRFLCFNNLEDTLQIKSSLAAILADKGSPYQETAKLAQARLYQQAKDYRRAFPLFGELAQSKKGDVSSDATLQAALCAQQVGDKKQSLIWFEKAFAHAGLKKWRGQTQFTLMNLHYEAKEFDQVITVFEKGRFDLKPQPHLQRLIMASKSYEALGMKNRVIKLYEEISRLAPESDTGFQATYRVLVRDHEAGKNSFARDAESFLKRYAAERAADKRYQSARLLLATHSYERKDYPKAISQYEMLNLALIDPSNRLGVSYHLTKSYLATKQDEKSLDAIALFQKTYPSHKRVIPLRLERAEILSKLKRDDEALIDYEAVLDATKDPKLQSAILQRLGGIYQEKKDNIRFIAIQQRILTIPGISPKVEAAAHFWLGWEDFSQKKYDRAVPQLRKAREMFPQDFASKVGPLLIRAAYQSEDLVTLEKEINLLRKSDPKAKAPQPIVRWLGATLAKKGVHARAWPFLNNSLKDPKDATPLMWKLYSDTALETGHPAEALRAADERLKLETHPYRKAETLFQKSLAHTDLKQFNDARQTASDALDLHPKGELNLDLRMHAGDIDMAAKKPQEALRHYVVVESLYAKERDRKIAATEKVIAALQGIGTPDAIKQIPEYRAILDKLKAK